MLPSAKKARKKLNKNIRKNIWSIINDHLKSNIKHNDTGYYYTTFFSIIKNQYSVFEEQIKPKLEKKGYTVIVEEGTHRNFIRLKY